MKEAQVGNISNIVLYYLSFCYCKFIFRIAKRKRNLHRKIEFLLKIQRNLLGSFDCVLLNTKKKNQRGMQFYYYCFNNNNDKNVLHS